MKRLFALALVVILLFPLQAEEWIRINQLGYLPQSIKVAVFMSEEGDQLKQFQLVDAYTQEVVKEFDSLKESGSIGNMKSTYRLNFSDYSIPGVYYLKAGKAVSPRFPINAQVYNGTADFLLNYMRQQRCGYNPMLKDSCHDLRRRTQTAQQKCEHSLPSARACRSDFVSTAGSKVHHKPPLLLPISDRQFTSSPYLLGSLFRGKFPFLSLQAWGEVL